MSKNLTCEQKSLGKTMCGLCVPSRAAMRWGEKSWVRVAAMLRGAGRAYLTISPVMAATRAIWAPVRSARIKRNCIALS